MHKKRVSIIGTNGIPARYGGFETLTEYLAKELNNEYDVRVYCSKTPIEKRLKSHHNSRLIYLPFKANGWQSMIYDALSILHAYISSDVLVILGYSGVISFPLKTLFRKTIIFNIGGIEWKKVRGSKALSRIEIVVKKWFERVCILFSDIVVVDNQVLFDYVRNAYSIDCVLVEYGGEHAVSKTITEQVSSKYPFTKSKYDISVSRAQEDMNIHILIEAYKEIPQRNLVIVSNWEITEYGKRLKLENKDVHPNIFLLDAIYNQDELNTLRSNASLYLHSHSLCGTAPSLVEAMYLGLPVVCFDVETNHASTEDKSYYFHDVRSLRSILSNLDDRKIDLLATNMLEIAKRRYTWKRIVGLYQSCIEGEV